MAHEAAEERTPQHGPGHASEQPLPHPGMAVASHDDEIGVLTLGEAQDLLGDVLGRCVQQMGGDVSAVAGEEETRPTSRTRIRSSSSSASAVTDSSLATR